MFPTQDTKQTEEPKEVLSLEPLKLHTLIERSNEIQARCSDYMIRGVNETNARFMEDFSLRYLEENGSLRNPMMTQYSLGQLCTKIGVPTQYILKCFNTGRVDLALENVNDWLSDYNSNLFIREYDGKVRGVLSDRFAVCDTPDILEVVDDVLNLNKFRIKGSFMNEERLHLRLVEKTMLPIDGEDLFCGMTIDSSDVGRSRLLVSFFIWKQVCTNGLCVSQGSGQLFSQKHVGITAEDFQSGLIDAMHKYDIMCDTVTDHIKKCQNQKTMVSKRMSSETLEMMIAQIKTNTRLSDEGAKKVITLMTDGTYSNSKWGMINAITQVAQDYTLERRIELEKIAGSLLIA